MHYQLKEWQVYCKSLFHGRTTVYEEYIEYVLTVFVIRVLEFQKTNSDHLGKRKIRHPTIEAKFWNQVCPKNWVTNLLKKSSIKTVITYNNISSCQITVYLENSRLWDQIWPIERMMKILRNRHWIHNQHITSNSCASQSLT